MDLGSAMQTLGYSGGLGGRGATDPDQLKRAFKKAAFEAHPDRNGGDERRFREVLDAYALLSGESRYSQATRQRGQAGGTGKKKKKKGSDTFNAQYGYANADLADLDDIWSEIGFNPYTGESFAPRPPKQQADEAPEDEPTWEAGGPGVSSGPSETDVSSVAEKGFRVVYDTSPRQAPQQVKTELSIADWITLFVVGVVGPVCLFIFTNDPDFRDNICERRASMTGKQIEGCERDGPANVLPPRLQ